MRFLVFALLAVPCLTHAWGCGCEEIEKQIKKERAEDARMHGCRSCKPITQAMEGCPTIGYDCDSRVGIVSNVLHPTDSCVCSEARCAGHWKLATKGGVVSKLKCNNSEWFAGEEKAEGPMICVKSCDTGVCLASNPNASSADFKPLTITAATSGSRCSTGSCNPHHGMTVINADGTPFASIPIGMTYVTCSSSGYWAGTGVANGPYIMCNVSPCGPMRCPAVVPGTHSSEVMPLTIISNGKDCAVAKCPGGFVAMNKDGTEDGMLETSEITCQEDGKWKETGDTTHDYVMCRQPPCEFGCDLRPPQVAEFGTKQLNAAIRKDCSFSCAAGETLFRALGEHPTPILSAQCVQSGQYSALTPAPLTVSQIGCYRCDWPDGPVGISLEPNAVYANMASCILTCPKGYKLQYKKTLAETDPWFTTARLYRQLTATGGRFFDVVNMAVASDMMRCTLIA
ncbi:hypothetical protein PRIPAC_93599 [Pristionchus pacificus]|uniref:Uncharacterized protein n=1 Tax=Pristionchus pacificus TaxID=54126 RepID=A0A2A6CE60_PRIPA|nr:hypothetical protein PRIPAC_93599 [Pristionchus pacificus]|eukprot:PDM76397.1 hypothetical protein PRIPAC_40001 [Pristionchus pacificus]